MGDEHVCQTYCGNHPQVCVDWCDAYAYCAAAGKRLCGEIGGGPAAYDDPANVALNQWFAACSAGGQNDYPYGDAFDPQACNGLEKAGSGCDSGACTTLPVAALPSCVSPDGVFDLSGNVSSGRTLATDR